jgi:threonylcarbamoyladenosine tRNA methylthiotransferase CDKAL1
MLDDIEDLVGAGARDLINTPATSIRSITPPRRSRAHPEVYAKQSTAPRQKNGTQLLNGTSPANAEAIPGTQTIYMKTQGCSHNVSDSEYMAGLLASYGYTLTEEWSDDVDLYLFNSCTVKGPSQDSFLNMVSKARESGKPVVVAGCVPQGQPDRSELSDLSVIGVQQIHRVVEVLHTKLFTLLVIYLIAPEYLQVVEEALKGSTVRLLGQRVRPKLDLPKIRRNPLVEIVPISTGCLNNCRQV